jgi:nucleotide-binding universal stress UspA family protein
MYKRILLALDTTSADQRLLAHVTELASEHPCLLVLLHVADGWAARHFDELKLAESQEMKDDLAYLEKLASDLRSRGLNAKVRLALGDPPEQILKAAAEEQCDLIAMTSHGHRLLGDVVLGSTINPVRHHARVPLLVIPAV